MVAHPRPFWSILIFLTTIAFVYLTFVNTTIDQDLPKPENLHSNVKNIVAYSLLKKIEIESEHYACPGDYGVINGSREGDNDRWTNVDGSALYILSVHMDRRLDPYNYVRIIGMIRGNLQEIVYCQISSPEKPVYVAKVTIIPIWWDIWDQNDTNIYFSPVLLSCRVPFGFTPESVSITTTPCDTARKRDFQLANYRERTQYSFTVCVKPLDFLEDISERLIQWIELIRILGGERIEIYVKRANKNVWNILKWYNLNYPGQIVVRKFQVIKESTSNKNNNFSRILWQKRRYEVATYNTCFYRNIAISQYIVPLDIDELILPNNLFNWREVLQHIFKSLPELKDNFASFMVPNAYFFGGLPKNKEEIFFLRNILRTKFSPDGESGKSFISTRNTLTVFNHYALDVLRPGISRTFFLPSNVVQLNHYKETCSAVILPECVKYVSSRRIKDPVVLKYKETFINVYSKRISMLKKLALL